MSIPIVEPSTAFHYFILTVVTLLALFSLVLLARFFYISLIRTLHIRYEYKYIVKAVSYYQEQTGDTGDINKKTLKTSKV